MSEKCLMTIDLKHMECLNDVEPDDCFCLILKKKEEGFAYFELAKIKQDCLDLSNSKID